MRPKGAAAILKKAGVPALILTNSFNIRYLTGVQADPAFVLIQGKKKTLYVSELDWATAQREAYADICTAPFDDIEDDMKKIQRCGFEAEDVSVKRMSRWKRKFKNTKFVQTSGIIEEYRETKGEDELRKFKRAQRITKEMMRRIPSALKVGVTEKEIAWKIESWAHELGAEGLSFEPIVAFGTHSACPHHRATNRKLIKGHVVQIDCGAKYLGYCADRSEVFFTTAVTSEQARVLKAVKEAKNKAKAAVRPGVKGAKLDAIAREVLSKYGYEEYFTHTLGHGVGLEIHEEPRLSKRAKKVTLKKNEIITIEPGVYLPGKFGIRLEEEVIV